jgi:ATP-dependent Lon protease
LGLSGDFFKDEDLHVHLPAGATPKDGPSAGITMATAIVSLFTGKLVRDDIAMTGEITLQGRVFPIGGLKEKILAAYRYGIKEVIVPYLNRTGIDDVPKEVRDKMTFHFVKNLREVVKIALKPEEKEPEEKKGKKKAAKKGKPKAAKKKPTGKSKKKKAAAKATKKTTKAAVRPKGRAKGRK